MTSILNSIRLIVREQNIYTYKSLHSKTISSENYQHTVRCSPRCVKLACTQEEVNTVLVYIKNVYARVGNSICGRAHTQ